MNRRRFIQSMAAAFTLPAASAVSLKPVMAALPTATPSASAAAMATKARFWAIYMHGLQGSCSPATLSTVLNIPESQARGYVSRLVTEGVIKPNPLIKNSVSKLVKSDDNSLVNKLKDRLEMKREATEIGEDNVPVEEDAAIEELEETQSEISDDEKVLLEDEMEISALNDSESLVLDENLDPRDGTQG